MDAIDIHDHASLTPQEAEILSHWDKGLGSAAIAANTRFNERYVRKVLSTFLDSGEDRLWQRNVASATAALGRAIEATGRRFA